MPTEIVTCKYETGFVFPKEKNDDCQLVLTLTVIIPQPLFFKTVFRSGR